MTTSDSALFPLVLGLDTFGDTTNDAAGGVQSHMRKRFGTWSNKGSLPTS